MQTHRRRERCVACDVWFYSGGSRTTIKLRWRPSILDHNSALNIKVPNPTCWVFVQLGRSPHEFPSLIPQRIWQGKPNAFPLGKWCSDVFRCFFSLGEALFSFHFAFKDSIDSLILGVFFLARLCPYLLLVTCLQEKQKVLAKDAKGAKGKKPRGGKSWQETLGRHDWVNYVPFFWHVKIQYISFKIS